MSDNTAGISITGFEDDKTNLDTASVAAATANKGSQLDSVHQKAQDVAEQEGVSYQDLATSTENRPDNQWADYDAGAVKESMKENVNVKPAESYIDKATSTVAGQMEQILGSNSPYIQLNERSAYEEAAGRGLRNTSIATQKGREAAIAAALPIAQQDAQTYSQFQQAKQAQDYKLQQIQGEGIVSGEMVKQEASITQQHQNIQNSFEARMQGLDAQSKARLADLQHSIDKDLLDVKNKADSALLDKQLSHDDFQTATSLAGEAIQNYMIAVENMLTDPDFLDLGQAAVNTNLRNMRGMAVDYVEFIGDAYDTDLGFMIDEYLRDWDTLSVPEEKKK